MAVFTKDDSWVKIIIKKENNGTHVKHHKTMEERVLIYKALG